MADARSSLAEMARQTPASRDRYIDLLRALSIAVVVIGHWLIASIYVDSSGIRIESALDAMPIMQYATWGLQVMPLFFFVGGFSNLVGWRATVRRDQTYGDFLAARAQRLMKPTFVFIGAWLVLTITVGLLFGDGGRTLIDATALVAKPLWFLAVYILIVSLAPLMVRLHDRFGWRVPALLVASVVVVDILRLGFEIPYVGVVNFALVWLIPHQLGFFYAEERFRALPVRRHLQIALGGLVSLVGLTSIGVYSRSMVGVATGEGASNNSPPSLCLIALTVSLIGIAMTLRPLALRWLSKKGPWTAVIGCNTMIMTIFLWHLTAVVIVVAILYPLGWPQPATGTGAWWALRPAWIALLALSTVPLVAIFARFERERSARSRQVAPHGSLRTAFAVAAMVAGLALFAQEGFSGTDLTAFGAQLMPWLPAIVMAGGYRMLVHGGSRRHYDASTSLPTPKLGSPDPRNRH